MKMLRYAALLSTTLLLAGCNGNSTLKQWLDPDKTFEKLPQPDIKGVNDTQEDMAKEALANGDFPKAAKFYELLVTTGKGAPEQQLRYKLGWASTLRRMGDNDHALAMFEQLTKENPANIEAAEGRALTLMALGKTVDASRAFSDIMEKEPTRWRTLNALGILFVTKNMIPEAMAYYTEALKHSPDNPAILNNVGLSQAVDKEYAHAIDALEQASRLSKNAAQRKQIELNEALVYGVSGDLDKAREVASHHVEGAALDNNMGLYAHLSKNDALAKTYLNMALSQSPVFYERAWSNLDVVNDTSQSQSTAPSGSATLPKINNK